ncbi:hypothetical protein V2J09_006483 [Rumex salicifolius]
MILAGVGENMLTTTPFNASDILGSMSNNAVGSATVPSNNKVLDSAFTPSQVLYHVQRECANNRSSIPLSIAVGDLNSKVELTCAQGQFLWRNSSSEINKEIYKGYANGNSEGRINELAAAYDFLNSNGKIFNVIIWYNATNDEDTDFTDSTFSMGGPLTRVSRLVNLVSNAYLQYFQKDGTKIQFEFVKEMPKQQSQLKSDGSDAFGVLLYAFVIMGSFPPVLTLLVYENQNRLRMMMKMHGLGDGPYWLITYSYFLALSSIYLFSFVVFGSFNGLKIFTFNAYSLQFVFYFLYANLQISFAFLLAPLFSNVSTARVMAYIIIIGTGLLGMTLFERYIEMPSFQRTWIILMELFPGFAMYRGLYELEAYMNSGVVGGFGGGMNWENLNDSSNGMKEVMLIMFVEWLIVLLIAYKVDRLMLSGRSAKLCTFSCFPNLRKKSLPSLNPSMQRSGSGVLEKPDVIQEREKVEQLMKEGSVSEAIITDDLAKVYPARDGNPPKAAVKGVSLALPRGECFGMLGPNGAGKTSFISMMIGLSKPTSGKAFVDGKDILTQMEDIYSSMGVCPQHDLLWESLTGREHLLFYGRLKNLKGSALKQAVDESLKSVNLYHGGIADKFVGKYSGGMKRRLSVAISLIGHSKVVYLDEPSTGLDPASRNSLWDVVRRAKQDRAIILTTHSMEEAEVLCDRLGIFVDGSLQCIGNPKELKARYGGSFVLTITTASTHEEEVERMVKRLSPIAEKIYQISGTQKFELPKQLVRISDVFKAVQEAKKRFAVNAWGVADTTLEDVFIKVARHAQAFTSLD